jgi:hypothetical protein
MSQGTAFHDTSSTSVPAYEFVARPKNAMSSGNPTFGGVPIPAQAAAPLAPGYLPDKPRGLTRLQRSLVAVPLVAVALALATFLGSLGLKAYRDHQRTTEIANTRVVLPASILGMTRHGAPQAQATKLVDTLSTPTPPQAAAYAAGKARVGLVLAGQYAMTGSEQHDYLVGVQSSVKSLGFTLTPSRAGRLGGSVWCGANARKAETLCAFTDVAAYGVVVVPGTGTVGESMAEAFRSAVEHRK